MTTVAEPFLDATQFECLFFSVHPMPTDPSKTSLLRQSVLAWPAWLRLLAVLPALALLWLAVLWASAEAVPL
jgi:hypothetical protein